jgi:hypothetical protein
VLQWAGQAFGTTTSRHVAENLATMDELARKRDSLAHHIGTLRDSFRNPLAHGERGQPIRRHDYSRYCDLVYGAASLAQWLDVGTNPALHPTMQFGWLSFLTFARAQRVA